MSPVAGFASAFGLTLLLLATAVALGFAHKRRTHVAFVLASVGALVLTICEAYRLGEVYDVRAAGTIATVHLALAKVATAALLLPIASGIRLWFTGRGRKLHRVFALLALTLIAVSAVTGVWMMRGAVPR